MGRGGPRDRALGIAEQWEPGKASHQLLHCFIQAGPSLVLLSAAEFPAPAACSGQGSLKSSVRMARVAECAEKLVSRLAWRCFSDCLFLLKVPEPTPGKVAGLLICGRA